MSTLINATNCALYFPPRSGAHAEPIAALIRGKSASGGDFDRSLRGRSTSPTHALDSIAIVRRTTLTIISRGRVARVLSGE